MAEEYVKAFVCCCWFAASLRSGLEGVDSRVLLSYSSRQYSTAPTQREGCGDISAMLTHCGDKSRHFTTRPFTLQTSEKKC
jgi:hypothetical protein